MWPLIILMAALCHATDCVVSDVWVEMLEPNPDCAAILFKMNHFKAARESLPKRDP